jgi:hypothetical protein
MTFAVAAGYGIAICIATTTLIGLFSIARPPGVARSSARRMPQGEPLRPNWPFGRKDIR